MISNNGSAVRVSVGCAFVYCIFAAIVLWTHDFDPSWFVRFGAEAPQSSLGTRLLGGIVTHPGVGADGQYFWILAHDPLLKYPRETSVWLDLPVYRAQRVAYPAMAALWRIGGERGVLWALLLINLVIVAFGSYLTSCLAVRLGLPARTGLAFAFNPGVMFAVMFDLCDALALAAMMGALYSAVSKRYWTLVFYSVLAALAKEPSLLGLGAAAFFIEREGTDSQPLLDAPTRLLLFFPAALAAGAWALYVRSRLGWSFSDVGNLSLPFVGFFRAWQIRWAAEGRILEIFVAGAVLMAAGAVVVLFAKRRTLILTAAMPYALLVPFLGVPIVLFMNNALRAFAPAFTFLWLEVYRKTGSDSPLT